MGVQILETCVGIARLTPNEVPVVYVNTGGLTGGTASQQLTKIFDCAFEIRENDEYRKTPYWEPGCADEVFRNRERILKFIQLKHNIPHEKYHCVLHVRARDKSCMKFDTYMKLAKIAEQTSGVFPVICTDDTSLPYPPCYLVSNETAISDWYTMLASNVIFCGPSTFPITTLLFDPYKHIYVASEKSCDGDFPNYTNDYTFIREAQIGRAHV